MGSLISKPWRVLIHTAKQLLGDSFQEIGTLRCNEIIPAEPLKKKEPSVEAQSGQETESTAPPRRVNNGSSVRRHFEDAAPSAPTQQL